MLIKKYKSLLIMKFQNSNNKNKLTLLDQVWYLIEKNMGRAEVKNKEPCLFKKARF